VQVLHMDGQIDTWTGQVKSHAACKSRLVSGDGQIQILQQRARALG
jgi:hypothetical protein